MVEGEAVRGEAVEGLVGEGLAVKGEVEERAVGETGVAVGGGQLRWRQWAWGELQMGGQWAWRMVRQWTWGQWMRRQRGEGEEPGEGGNATYWPSSGPGHCTSSPCGSLPRRPARRM